MYIIQLKLGLGFAHSFVTGMVFFFPEKHNVAAVSFSDPVSD